MAGSKLVAWGLVMNAGAIAAVGGLLAGGGKAGVESTDPTKIIYFWGASLLIISGVMLIVDYVRAAKAQ